MKPPGNETGKQEVVSSEVSQSVKIFTEKDAAFRIHHADGAWGMLNSVGNIQLSFFVEHIPMPSAVIFRKDAEGRMSIANMADVTVAHDDIDPEKLVLVRNYQSAIVMSLPAAKQVAVVLANFIDMAEVQIREKNE